MITENRLELYRKQLQVRRFTGTLIITGEISDVTSALTEVVDYFRDSLGYVVCDITKR